MATIKLSDYYKPLTIPTSGGINLGALLSAYPKSPIPGAIAAAQPAPAVPVGANMSTVNGPVVAPAPTLSSVAAGGPMRPAPALAPSVASPYVPKSSSAPVGPTGATGTAPKSQVPQQYLNADGSIKTPAQVAADVAGVLGKTSGQGDVGKLALGTFGGDAGKSSADLAAEARKIGNTRNDIAVGATDPYKVASDSGIAYTPAELNAIEQAYAGVYDPALDSALEKVKAKQATEAAAAGSNDSFTLGKDQTRYDAKGNVIASGPSSSSGSGSGGSGTYVPGENPTVDSWAQRISDGNAKITDIPAAQSGLRNAVVVALQSQGTDLTGHPTTTELGKNSLTAAQALLKKLDDRVGTGAVGKTSIFNAVALPGSENKNFQIDFQNLKDMLSLDGVRYLKGQGAVSDAERALLASAVTKLNLAQSEGDFRTTLTSLINTLANGSNSTDSAAGGVTVSAGGQTYSFQDQASADAFKKEAGL